jgi:hypothetical protein
METLIIQPKTKAESNLFEQLAKALKVPLQKTKDKSPYNPKFVEKIKRSEKNFAAGKFKAVKIEDLWK